MYEKSVPKIQGSMNVYVVSVMEQFESLCNI